MPAAARPPALAPPAGAVRGECPSLDRPMEAADGLLVRVRVPGGSLSRDQARALARAAARDGSGVVELTSRANVQLRGVRPEALAGLRADLAAAGLPAAAPADVVVAPAAGLDPTEVADVRPLARELVLALASEPEGRHPKAGVLLDGGGAVSLRGRSHDVGLGAARRRDTGELVAELALGAPLPLGADPADPTPVVPLASAPLVAASALAAAGAGRVRDLVRSRGVDEVVDAVTLASGVAIERVPAGGLDRAEALGRAPLGVHPAGERAFVGAAALLGRLDADQLALVAEATGHGDGTVRLTPWRSVIVPGVAPRRATAVLADLGAAGLVTAPDDPAASVVACVGRAGCPAGLTDTLADARHLIAARLSDGADGADGGRVTVHVSGCGKRCASRAPHDVTLIGVAPDRYDVFLGDRLARTGVTLADATEVLEP